MANEQTQPEQLPELGTFVLGQLGRTAVVLGDVRDIVANIGKTVTVHADGETRRVKLSEQWHSARHGGTYFPLYRETGELKRNGEPKRTRTGYNIGAAHIGNVTAEPMTFDDAMLFLNSANDVPAVAQPKGKGTRKGNSSDSSDSSPAPNSSPLSLFSPEQLAALSPEQLAALVANSSPAVAQPAPNSSPKGKGTGTRKPRKRAATSSPKGKGNSSDSVDAMLSEL